MNYARDPLEGIVLSGSEDESEEQEFGITTDRKEIDVEEQGLLLTPSGIIQ